MEIGPAAALRRPHGRSGRSLWKPASEHRSGVGNPLDWSWLRNAAWAVAAFFALVVVFKLVLPREVPFGLLLFGVVIGCINAMTAIGLILVYRSNRIINFAAAEIGLFGAILFQNLVRDFRWPWLVAVPLSVAAAAALAGVVEILFVRRFFRSPRLILTLVTIGIAQVVVFLTYATTSLFGEIEAFGSVDTPFSEIERVIGGVVFGGNAFVLLAIVPVLIVLLNTFLKYTDFGVAVRAAAESGDRASLLGVPVKRVSTVMWVLAGAFTALGFILRAPVVGVVSGASVLGPGLLLRALTAAVIARMEDLRVAVAAAVFIGIVEQATYFAYEGSTVSDLIFVVLIIAALLVQRRKTSRAEEGDTSSWALVDQIRAVPKELRRLPEVVGTKVALGAALAVGLAMFAATASSSSLNLASAIVIYAIVAVSLVVLTGWAGQISLGQFGIVGFGAAVSARLVADAHWDFLLAMLVGGLAAAGVSMVLGLAALRIKGFFFAVTSLGFAVAVETFFLNQQYFTLLLPVNRPERPMFLERFDLESESAFLWFSLGVLAFVVLAVSRLARSRTGRALQAIRDNERAAQSYGINQARAKLLAFGISGFIAGVAGALYAVHQHAVTPSAFASGESLRAFSMVVIGGLGSLPGALLGAVFVRGASFYLDPELAFFATGAGLLVVLLVLPGGLGRLVFRLRDRGLRWVAQRRSLVVPSLVADVRQDPVASVEPEPTVEDIAKEVVPA